jgi:hypothetical protein
VTESGKDEDFGVADTDGDCCFENGQDKSAQKSCEDSHSDES